MFVHRTTLSPLGSGACGACPLEILAVIAVDAQGRFTEAFTDMVEVGPRMHPDDGPPYVLETGEWHVAPDATWFEFRGTRVAVDEETWTEALYTLRYTWDVANSSYVRGASP